MSRIHRWSAALAAAVLLAASGCGDDPGPLGSPGPAPRAAAWSPRGCLVKDAAFSRGLRHKNDELTQELNDWGRLLYDAEGTNGIACVDSAAVAMRDKLNATLNQEPNHYDRFLSGAHVALIYAAADRIGANGGMTPGLDSALARVEGSFVHTDVGDSCAYQSTDNCMDGHAVSASAYGWIAAYRAARGWSATDALSRTRDHVGLTLTNACVFSGYGRPLLCNGTVDSIRAGTATTLSLNLGYESIPYGFGLMTSVAAAVRGYEAAAGTYPFSEDDRVIARELLEEAQRAITGPPFAFISPCPKPVFDGAKWIGRDTIVNCGEGTYRPNLYSLNAFYTARIGGIPAAGPYLSNTFDQTLFQTGASSNDFLSFGRLATYGLMGYEWWLAEPAHRPRPGTQAPRGTLDRIDANRFAYGWACDPDVGTGSVRVELRATGVTGAVTLRADQASEQAVNTICGGTAHRFSVQLPVGWAGKAVTAKAIDYLGYGSATLPCGQGPCSVAAPPSVSVAWVLPSGLSWGPPNTLTAAGHAANGSGTVELRWRDLTTGGPWTTVSYRSPVASDGTWSNTIPVSNYCHEYQVTATYAGVTSAVFPYRGRPAGHCPETARVIWIQPQTTAGWGTPGALIVAGDAAGAPAGTQVRMTYRDLTAGGSVTTRSFAPVPDANGIWINDIPGADFTHRYEVKVTYDVITHTCTYAGTGTITWC